MNVQEAIKHPSLIFDSPAEILKSTQLDQEQKLLALYNWRETALQKSLASNEGMNGREKSRLQEVSIAIMECSRVIE